MKEIMQKSFRRLPRIMKIEEKEDLGKYEFLKEILDDRAERPVFGLDALFFVNPFGETRWLTNIGQDEQYDFLAELRQYNRDGSFFFVGSPKPSDTYTVAQLKNMGMVGVYCTEPPKKNRIADIWPLLNIEKVTN